jgi:tRNA 2-selenouridine synthase
MNEIDDLQRLLLTDTPLIDTRAPIEFARGSLPAAVNLPLMTDYEREQVGTCYKRHGQKAAIELGHQLVQGDVKAERIAAWADFAKAHPTGALYCFRGGLRSAIAQQWLHESGIEYPRVKGGYKSLRRWLIEYTDQTFASATLLLVGGRTGAAKTRVLNEGNAGQPILGSVDLEGLAHHRGSAFGRRTTEQPTQISFEMALGVALLKHNQQPHPCLILEDEGRLIGRCALPLSLQAARKNADWIHLEAHLDDRVQHSYENYILGNLAELQASNTENAFEQFSESLLESLERIRKRLGTERYRNLESAMTSAIARHQQGDPEHHRVWIATLLTEYYDPMYDYQLRQRERAPIFHGDEQAVVEYLIEQQRRLQ